MLYRVSLLRLEHRYMSRRSSESSNFQFAKVLQLPTEAIQNHDTSSTIHVNGDMFDRCLPTMDRTRLVRQNFHDLLL